MIQFERAYDSKSSTNNYRVLVDRLWPRGVKKTELEIDWWPKEITPSHELRKFFHENKEKNFEAFKQAYQKELLAQEAQKALNELKEINQAKNLTLVSAVRDKECSHVAVLQEALLN